VIPYQLVGIAFSDSREFLASLPLAEYLLCFWTQTIPSPVEFAQASLARRPFEP
jgi:hypothetical protein